MRSQGSNVSSSEQRRLLSVCADAHIDLSLRWAHMQFCKNAVLHPIEILVAFKNECINNKHILRMISRLPKHSWNWKNTFLHLRDKRKWFQ